MYTTIQSSGENKHAVRPRARGQASARADGGGRGPHFDLLSVVDHDPLRAVDYICPEHLMITPPTKHFSCVKLATIKNKIKSTLLPPAGAAHQGLILWYWC